MKFLKRNNTNVIGLFLICLIVLSIVVVQYVIRQQTSTTTKAAKSSTLSFSQPTKPIGVGDTFSLDIILDPGNNKISSVKLVIAYNPKVLERGNPGIVPNTNVFPQVFEGPTYHQCFSNSCTMSISLSIGSDLTKVVQGQSPGPIASVNFKALEATNDNGTPVSFGNGTMALSLSPADEPSENVANFSPASLVIGGQSATPSAGLTTAAVSLHFEGIDSNNNPAPKHPQRQAVLSFYKENTFTGDPIASIPFVATYGKGAQADSFFNNTIDISKASSGAYFILVKSPEGSLREPLNNSQAVVIVPGQNNKLTLAEGSQTEGEPLPLRMGDLNNDNNINITDYNVLIDCYGKKQTSSSCIQHRASDTTKGLFADLNDDNIVSGIDYNILIRHFGESGY